MSIPPVDFNHGLLGENFVTPYDLPPVVVPVLMRELGS